MKKIFRNIKPPLGVMPLKIWLSCFEVGVVIPIEDQIKRYINIKRAIRQYVQQNRQVSVERINEYNMFIEMFESEKIIVEEATE